MVQMSLRTERLIPGMQVAQSVVSFTGQVLLEGGMDLTPQYIKDLTKWGVSSVDVVIPRRSDNLRRYFSPLYQETIELIAEAFERVRIFEEVPIATFKELAENYIELMLDMVGVIDNLSRVRAHNEYTFNHSLNVAIICGLIGKWLGYTGQNLKDLILTGLLHDIGKAIVPLEILNKPGKLTVDEMDVVKRHPSQGYNLLRKQNDIRDEIKMGILQHHERQDGSGYPQGLTREKICDFGSIVSIADMYDAMTTTRVYRKKMSAYFGSIRTPITEVSGQHNGHIRTP